VACGNEKDPNPEPLHSSGPPLWVPVCTLKIHSLALSKDSQDDTHLMQLLFLSLPLCTHRPTWLLGKASVCLT